MSIEAMVWVFDQDIKPSTAKFVLLALADNCREEGIVWPSLSEICRKTSMNIKTVIANLDILEELGVLVDTGDREGATGQIKVYRINGLPSSDRHYVYKLTHKETGEFYIGVRSTISEIEQDDYYGSGKWPQSIKRKFLEKSILGVFDDRSTAEAFERAEIIKNARNPLCRNILSKKIKRSLKIERLPRLVTLPRTDGKVSNFGDKHTQSWKPEPKVTLNEPANGAEHKNYKEITKSGSAIFNSADVQSANIGDPAYLPDKISSFVLPGGWEDAAAKLKIPHERIYESWRKFCDVSAYPFMFSRWQKWVDRDFSAQNEDYDSL